MTGANRLEKHWGLAVPWAATTSAFAGLVGIAVLIGWQFRIPFLKAPFPTVSTFTPPNSALCFIFLALSLWLQREKGRRALSSFLGMACAAFVFLFASLTLLEHTTGLDIGIDRLFFAHRLSDWILESPVGRVPSNAALAFVPLALALLLLDRNWKKQPLSEILSLAATLVAFLGLIGYWYGVPYLYGGTFVMRMTLQAAITFLVLSTGVFFARPEKGLAALLLSRDISGVIARRLTVTIVIVLPLLGWLGIKAEAMGIVGREFGTVLVICAGVVAFSILTLDTARRLRRQNIEREFVEALRLLAAIVESSDDAIISKSLDNVITTWNKGAERLYGYTAAEAIGQSMTLVVPPECHPELHDLLQRIRRGECVSHHESVRLCKDGRRVPVSVTLSPLKNDCGEITGASAIVRDTTERRRAEEGLRHAEEKYRRLFEDAVVGIFQSTPEGRFLSVNPALAQMYGYDSPEQLMAEVTDVGRQLFVEPNRYVEGTRLLEHGGVLRNVESEIYCKDGSKKWILANVRAVRGTDGKMLRREGTVQDITERKAAEGQVQFLAYYDALTGLPNRPLFQDRLAKALASARRRREKVALLFLDLDRFKTVNNSLGHSVGDLLLKGVAERLKKWAREQDTVARLGGDEFVLVLTGVKDTADAAVAADRLMKAITPAFVVQEHVLSVTCSLGISVFPDHGTDGETLLKNADAAMYCAKDNGRNNFQFFTQDMNIRAVERLTLENSLRMALERKELFLEYQPQVDLATGKIIGAEALLRWRHPELGLVPPSKFIPIAENSGMIIPIGEWVLRTACTQARLWQDEGLAPLTVAVNVSVVQFRQEQFCQVIRTVLDETGLPAQYLELEITESLLSDADVVLSALQKLKRIGVNLSIDDFGTGYSSLSYLRRFPVYKLKIDRSFVQAMTTNPDDAAIAATIINMAKTLRLKVIAEGVETEHQMLFLREHNCDEVQGYYFSKPLAVGDFVEKIRRQRRFPRYRTDLQLRVRDHLERDLEGRCGIISEGGLAVSLPEPLPVGIVVPLHFTVSTHPTPLHVMAVVRTQLGFQHGLEFVSLTEAEQVSIRQFCNELATPEACVPARP
jgi:diguanylate cyclase (GGDEF)-like protein/PAS domain S-box-containing protein